LRLFSAAKYFGSEIKGMLTSCVNKAVKRTFIFSVHTVTFMLF